MLTFLRVYVGCALHVHVAKTVQNKGSYPKVVLPSEVYRTPIGNCCSSECPRSTQRVRIIDHDLASCIETKVFAVGSSLDQGWVVSETIARTGAWVGICRLDTGYGEKSQGDQASGKARKSEHDEGRLSPYPQRGEKERKNVSSGEDQTCFLR